MELDHIAIAAHKISDALPAYEKLGLKAGHIEEVPAQGVRVAFLDLMNGCHVELLEPIDDSSPIAGFLKKRGPGLHHVAFRVDRIEPRMAGLKGAGMELLSDAPRPGSRGTKVCFLHPKSAAGVLIELVEHPDSVLDPRD